MAPAAGGIRGCPESGAESARERERPRERAASGYARRRERATINHVNRISRILWLRVTYPAFTRVRAAVNEREIRSCE